MCIRWPVLQEQEGRRDKLKIQEWHLPEFLFFAYLGARAARVCVCCVSRALHAHSRAQ